MPLNIDNVKKKIEELEVLANTIEKRGIVLLEQAPIALYEEPDHPDYDAYGWGRLDTQLRASQYEILVQYQYWYSLAHQIIKDYIPERSAEFTNCYSVQGRDEMWISGKGVIHYLRFSCSPTSAEDLVKRFTNDFMLQRSILLSLPDVIEIKQLGLRRAITADLARTEMDQAELLFEGGFHRAAGSIAGVALELHLKTLCDIDGMTYRVKATMNDFIDALKKERKIDDTQWRHFGYLASIRNQCAHAKEVSEKDVHRLIDEVRKLI